MGKNTLSPPIWPTVFDKTQLYIPFITQFKTKPPSSNQKDGVMSDSFMDSLSGSGYRFEEH
jgi:hypothetical protein